MATTRKFTVREGRSSDCEQIYHLIKELATYEKMGDRVQITPEVLKQHGFGKHKYFHLLVAECSPDDDSELAGKIGGYILFFFGYDPWQGKYLYVEDFYVTSCCRKVGMGGALWKAVIKVAAREQCELMQWCVLDWNQLAIDFYKRFGATDITKDVGELFRLSHNQLKEIASKIP